jgi:hypothetical protein
MNRLFSIEYENYSNSIYNINKKKKKVKGNFVEDDDDEDGGAAFKGGNKKIEDCPQFKTALDKVNKGKGKYNPNFEAKEKNVEEEVKKESTSTFRKFVPPT